MIYYPIKLKDPDGRKIRIPNVKERDAFLGMINDISAIHFKLNDNGELVPDGVNNNKKARSQTFSDALIVGINDGNTIDIQFGETYKGEDGREKNIYEDAGGGRTYRSAMGDSDGNKIYFGKTDITISSYGGVDVKRKNGKPGSSSVVDVLIHEMVGHAIPLLTGKNGDSVVNENVVRRELNLPERSDEESHPCFK